MVSRLCQPTLVRVCVYRRLELGNLHYVRVRIELFEYYGMRCVLLHNSVDDGEKIGCKIVRLNLNKVVYRIGYWYWWVFVTHYRNID